MEHISLTSSVLFNIGGVQITTAFVTTYIIMAILILMALFIKSRLDLIPAHTQAIMELVLDTIYSMTQNITNDRKKTDRLFPIGATIFLVVLVSNWFGLIPVLTSITTVVDGETFPLLRVPSTDLAFTFALSTVAMLVAWGLGFYYLGLGYLSKFFNFNGGSIVEKFINLTVGLMELVSEFARFLAFAFRLFGNIFAGEVLLIIIGSLSYYLVLLPFYGLEIFVGFIQAFVFSVLFLVFAHLASSKH